MFVTAGRLAWMARARLRRASCPVPCTGAGFNTGWLVEHSPRRDCRCHRPLPPTPIAEGRQI